MEACALSRAASRARPSTFKPALRSPRPGAPPPASAPRRSPRPRPHPAPRTPAGSNKGSPEPRPRTCLAHPLHYFCILDLWGPRQTLPHHGARGAEYIPGLLAGVTQTPTRPSRDSPSDKPAQADPEPPTLPAPPRPNTVSDVPLWLAKLPPTYTTLPQHLFPFQRPLPFSEHFLRLELSSQSPCRGIPLTESV